MKVRLTTGNFEITPELEKYAHTKAAEMAKHAPRRYRTTSDCWIYFSQVKNKVGTFNSCSVTFRIKDTELKAEETTLHMYAALDIATVHIQRQLDDFAVRTKRRRLPRSGKK